MAPSGPIPRIIRFGVFEIDLANAELRKHGLRIRIQEQPYQVLAALLERPGEVVSRDQLVRRLWPDGTFVDFDRGLNAAVTRLRQALSDSAESPRYVETVARRGYRFLMPIEIVNGRNGVQVPKPPAESPAVSGAGLRTAVPADEFAAERIRPGGRRPNRVWVYTMFAGFSLVTLAGIWLVSSRWTPEPVLEHITRDAGLTTEPAVSPDGRLVAYASDRGDRHLNVWIQQLDRNGKAVQLTHFATDAHQPSFSPDGNTIVFRAEEDGGQVYSIPAIGGQAVRLAAAGRNPRFSPDGKSIAYWVGPVMGPAGFKPSGELFVIPASGGEPKRLGNDLPAGGYPVWSPDGQSILVLAHNPCSDPATADWWTVPIHGGPPARTGALPELRKRGVELSPDHIPYAWSWRGNSILFSARIGDTINVAEALLSNRRPQLSGAVRKLTSGTDYDLYPMPASPNAIVFASLVENTAVWALPVNAKRAEVTGAITRLTAAPAPEYSPTLSRAGDKIAFISARTPTCDLWLKNLRTETEMPGPSTPGNDYRPRVSRDGKFVAFSRSLGDVGIYVAELDSGPPKKISSTSAAIWDWSPDSRYLLFRDQSRSESGINILDLQTGSEKVLFRKDGLVLFQANYSPSARELLVEAVDSTRNQSVLYVVTLSNNHTTGQWIPVGHSAGWEDKPRWSPDGNTIYFISHWDGFRCIWAQRLDAVSRRPVAPPFPVYHFHDTRLSLGNVGFADLEMDVGKDKIVVNIGELKGNIWRLRQYGGGR